MVLPDVATVVMSDIRDQPGTEMLTCAELRA